MDMKIDVLHKLCNDGKMKWTTHILARLQERGIQPSDVKKCIMTGKIIEEYMADYPYPSCLVLGFNVNGQHLHSVIGVGSDFLWLITAYYPNIEIWENDFKVRKVIKL